METLLLLGTVSMTLALAFYTAGVWIERYQHLNKLNLSLFWLGLVFDMTGTEIMSQIAGESNEISLHLVTGMIALVLMLVHAIWATITLKVGDERKIAIFHKYSTVIWVFWLIPYFTGLAIAMLPPMSV